MQLDIFVDSQPLPTGQEPKRGLRRAPEAPCPNCNTKNVWLTTVNGYSFMSCDNDKCGTCSGWWPYDNIARWGI